MNRTLHNWSFLKEARKKLRSTGTPAEAALWLHLRRSQLAGLKFRRQASIGPYIVDFYCPQARLIVELDGASHTGQEARDAQRDSYFEQLGFRVCRFENRWVFESLEVVLDEIEQVGLSAY